LAVAVAKCKSHRKCLGIHEVQAPEEDLDCQAVILIDSTYIEIFVLRLCYKINNNRKYTSEMPGNYQ